MAFVLTTSAALFCCLCIALTKWNEPSKHVTKGRSLLPPGTMGWPFFGETAEFLKLGPDFMKKQRSRYGSVFKSHILGCPTVVSMDPDLNRYILMNESKGFVPGYPQSMLDILGRRNIAAVHGEDHRKMRGTLLAVVGPAMIRDRLLPKIDEFMRLHLRDWDRCVIDIQEKTKEMALLSSLKQIAGIDSWPGVEAFEDEFFKLVIGTLSLPVVLPGTNYHRGFRARKNIVGMLTALLKERRASMDVHQDMLGRLMSGQSNYRLTDEEIIDQIITILYSGYETVSTTSMMAVKYLHDHPRVLEELRDEHFAIRHRKNPEDPITWEDLKSMRFTRAVILETSRLATVVNGVLRKTIDDTKVNGYFVPKGWRIYVYTREMNYDADIYPDPLLFDPWRWLSRSRESQSQFFLFGGGTRHCPGMELGIAEISTFLHYFVTRYRWEEVGGNKLMKFPRVEAPNGYRIRVDVL
ncbi:hypothetical protein MLD38_013157 [Melastoma candidum]|uniref:Uncharacterized protein n=1 Tax=Melastoma candidum TaxID=119954 RepID=A0ACB9R8A4_9MYRT|nr:hypothetical protein MLD38_013157 [Melastoma candidum]